MISPLSKFCELICGDTAEVLIGYNIYPICRKEYNLIVMRSLGKISLLYGAHNTRDFIAFIKEYTPQTKSYDDFLENIAPTREFISAYKERFYIEKKLSEQEEVLIAKVQELDCSTPCAFSGGRDGFSLTCWTPGCNKEFRIWCCHHDEYYKPITDLANALLDIANVNPEYRFSFYKSMI